jgi:hypothetical protein
MRMAILYIYGQRMHAVSWPCRPKPNWIIK